MARVSQWLSALKGLSDWRTSSQSGMGNPVSLEKQNRGFIEHPLPMGQPQLLGAGHQRPLTKAESQLTLFDLTEPELMDVLATEELAPIVDENGDPLGMA